MRFFWLFMAMKNYILLRFHLAAPLLKVSFWGRCEFHIIFWGRDMPGNVQNLCSMVNGRCWISSYNMKYPSPKCYITLWGMTIYMYSDTFKWSNISTTLDIITSLKVFTDFNLLIKFRQVFTEDLQRVRLVNRGRLLLRTADLVTFVTCIYYDIDTSLSCSWLVSELWIWNSHRYLSSALLAPEFI